MIDRLKPYPAYVESGQNWLGRAPSRWSCLQWPSPPEASGGPPEASAARNGGLGLTAKYTLRKQIEAALRQWPDTLRLASEWGESPRFPSQQRGTSLCRVVRHLLNRLAVGRGGNRRVPNAVAVCE
jgi:hypothetical protein